MLDPEPLGPKELREVDRFRWALELESNFAFHLIVADTLDVLYGALALLGKPIEILRPRPPRNPSPETSATLILAELDQRIEAAHGAPLLVDAMIAYWEPAWAIVFRRLNELRNGIEQRHRGPLLLAVTPGGETLLGREAPDLWSRRGSGMRLRDRQPPQPVRGFSEWFLPPAEPAKFESLCFDFFREIWNDPGAQKNARVGQPQAGVDFFGRAAGRWIGVQCKQRSGRFHTKLSLRELEKEAERARSFSPPLATFIIATHGARDVRLRQHAREASTFDFEVQVWSWDDIWQGLRQRRELLDRISPTYWPYAQRSLSRPPMILSEIEFTPGDLAGSTFDAEEAVVLADHASDLSMRLSARTELANSLHQAGRRAEALARFQEAETLQAERQPQYPLLSSLAGFQYCDLLLAHAEHAAGRGQADPVALEECRAVERRAADTLEWSVLNRAPLRDIALDHLTLGRVLLYQAVLEGSTTYDANAEIETAIDDLRRAGHVAYLALGLMTRAWMRSLLGDKTGAREDLAEAQEIAERGPMPLLLADVQLKRARLFHDRVALIEARRLIEEHGYGRRLEELADLEAMASGWQVTTNRC